jgi:hypothetical protein
MSSGVSLSFMHNATAQFMSQASLLDEMREGFCVISLKVASVLFCGGNHSLVVASLACEYIHASRSNVDVLERWHYQLSVTLVEPVLTSFQSCAVSADKGVVAVKM